MSVSLLAGSAAADDIGTEQTLTLPNAPEPRPTAAPNLLELGIYGGGLFPSSEHNFQDERALHQELGVAPSLGARVGYFPLQYLGLEGELDISRASVGDGSALLGAARAHVVAQLPRWRVTPFALAGVGRWFARSNTLGDDNDPGMHLGVGAKLAINRSIGLRLDLRDNLAQATGSMTTDVAHHPQILLSLSYTALFRKKTVIAEEQSQAPDQDADGIADADDACAELAGRAPHGCPDEDGDGVLGAEDLCPVAAGPGPSGCPDQDDDSVLDRDDQCPDLAGLTPHGCPDEDGDSILGEADKCPAKPETLNNFEDADGCPDTKPIAVKRFEGTIEGLLFPTGSAKIEGKSRGVLALAAKVLTEHPSIRLRIHGHTDDVGTESGNNLLSEKRADAVRAYLVATFAIDEARLEIQGHGSVAPVATGSSKAERVLNRRIEFELIR